jgi:hypothetical protein
MARTSSRYADVAAASSHAALHVPEGAAGWPVSNGMPRPRLPPTGSAPASVILASGCACSWQAAGLTAVRWWTPPPSPKPTGPRSSASSPAIRPRTGPASMDCAGRELHRPGHRAAQPFRRVQSSCRHRRLPAAGLPRQCLHRWLRHAYAGPIAVERHAGGLVLRLGPRSNPFPSPPTAATASATSPVAKTPMAPVP